TKAGGLGPHPRAGALFSSAALQPGAKRRRLGGRGATTSNSTFRKLHRCLSLAARTGRAPCNRGLGRDPELGGGGNVGSIGGRRRAALVLNIDDLAILAIRLCGRR